MDLSTDLSIVETVGAPVAYRLRLRLRNLKGIYFQNRKISDYELGIAPLDVDSDVDVDVVDLPSSPHYS